MLARHVAAIGESHLENFLRTANAVIDAEARSGDERVIYRFKGGADGLFPEATLTSFGGVLYGTTAFGAAFPNISRNGKSGTRYATPC